MSLTGWNHIAYFEPSFTAGITKGRGLLYIYSKIILLYILLNMGGLAWVFYSALRKVDDGVVLNCERSDGNDELVKQFCEKGFNFVKGLPIAFLITALLVQICEYFHLFEARRSHRL